MAIGFFDPVVGMLLNCKTNRWHPIYFKNAPLPGGHENAPARHKSGGHHTEGFATREEAVESAKKLAEALEKETQQKPLMAVNEDMLWDGEDVPATIAFFKDNGDGTATRLM